MTAIFLGIECFSYSRSKILANADLGTNWLVFVDFDGLWVGSLTIKLIYNILAWFLNLVIGPKYEPIGMLEEV